MQFYCVYAISVPYNGVNFVIKVWKYNIRMQMRCNGGNYVLSFICQICGLSQSERTICSNCYTLQKVLLFFLKKNGWWGTYSVSVVIARLDNNVHYYTFCNRNDKFKSQDYYWRKTEKKVWWHCYLQFSRYWCEKLEDSQFRQLGTMSLDYWCSGCCHPGRAFEFRYVEHDMCKICYTDNIDTLTYLVK